MLRFLIIDLPPQFVMEVYRHRGYPLLSTQKKIAYTETFVGELISRSITSSFADLPPIRINF